jgi:hypothetical protein
MGQNVPEAPPEPPPPSVTKVTVCWQLAASSNSGQAQSQPLVARDAYGARIAAA